MAIWIIVTNVLISAVGFALARQLMRWRRSLADLSAQLDLAERDLAQTLPQARLSLGDGATAVRRAKQQVDQLKSRWQQAQQVLTLIGILQTVGRRGRSR